MCGLQILLRSLQAAILREQEVHFSCNSSSLLPDPKSLSDHRGREWRASRSSPPPRRDRMIPTPQAKASASSATLSMAYAAVKFVDACLKGLRGDACIVECSFVASEVTELPFFAIYSWAGLEKARKELAESIQKLFKALNVYSVCIKRF